MKAATASSMQPYSMAALEGEAPVLVGTSINGVILDALSEVTVTQIYRNDETQTIEAVYTFPLPLDAILLDLNIRLGGREYRGEVMPRGKAEQAYEQAIKDGDSAIMLENPQPGAYTMNVGNLQPGDECVITFRYGMFHHWQGDTLRICLPTVIAPRYGDPAAGGFQPHQAPVTDLLADHSLTLNLAVKGALTGSAIASPSHQVVITKAGDLITVGLARGCQLDRDFILEITAPQGLPLRGYAARDGERTLAWTPFHPVFAGGEERPPLAVTVVVDCSGSMQGDSIGQAREALLRIVESLRPGDFFGLVRFGSAHACYAEKLVAVEDKRLADLRRYIEEIDADMGGTELGTALEAAYRLKGPKKLPVDVLLITDGQVSDWQKIAADAKRSGQRVFTVGVGSAVTEAAVRGIAEKSGGACELVSPRENMAGRIYRHFLRMQSPCGQHAAVDWGCPVTSRWPAAIDRLYSGDTLHQCAWFAGEPGEAARLTVKLPDGGDYTQTAVIVPLPEIGADTLPRLIAGYRLRDETDADAGERLAMDYRLLSPWTNYCAVIVREDGKAADELPALRTVAQMWPAGGHGVGSVHAVAALGLMNKVCEMPMFMRNKAVTINESREAGIFSKVSNWVFPGKESAPSAGQGLWKLLGQDDLQLDMILMALPDEIRSELVALTRHNLSLEDATIIFLTRLFEQLDPIRYSRQLARQVRRRFERLRVPYDLDRDEVEEKTQDLVTRILTI